jgi:hypothetical protein
MSLGNEHDVPSVTIGTGTYGAPIGRLWPNSHRLNPDTLTQPWIRPHPLAF